MILVDTTVIANAPVRFLVSGMGDALSTYFEARANVQSNTRVNAGLPCGFREGVCGEARGTKRLLHWQRFVMNHCWKMDGRQKWPVKIML